MDGPCAGGHRRASDVPGTGAVDRERLLGLCLGAVDIGPRGAVDDGIGACLQHRGFDGADVGDVELGAPERGQLVTRRRRGIRYVAPEHACGTRDQEPHRPRLEANGRRLASARRPSYPDGQSR